MNYKVGKIYLHLGEDNIVLVKSIEPNNELILEDITEDTRGDLDKDYYYSFENFDLIPINEKIINILYGGKYD